MFGTKEDHKRAIRKKLKLYEHMKMISQTDKHVTAGYFDAIERLKEDLQRHSKTADESNSDEFFYPDFELWPKKKERLSCGRSGDVDPGGVMTLQQVNRGYRYIGGSKRSVSNGEW